MSFWEDSSAPVVLDRLGRVERERAGLSVVVVVVLLLGVLGGAGYVAAHAAAGDRVPRGTTISGVDVGGLSRDAAIARLQAAFAARAHTPITLAATDATGADRTVTIRPAQVGLRIDAVASVDLTDPVRSWHPQRLWDYFSDAARRDAVALVDTDRLAARIRTMSGGFGAPPVDGRVVFTAHGVREIPGQAGDAVSLAAAVDALETAYLSGRSRAQVPLVPAPPAIDQADLTAALASFAHPAMSGPVTLGFGARRLTLQPRQYAAALAMVPQDGRLVPLLHWPRVLALVAHARTAIAPRDATVRLVGDRPRVVPARPGSTFTDAAVVTAFRSALTAHGAGRTRAVTGTSTQPTFTAADARALAIRTPIVSFAAPVASPADNARVRAGVAAVQGRVLRPGDVLRPPPGAGALAVALSGAAFRAGLADVTADLPVVVDPTVGNDVPAQQQFRNDSPSGVLVDVALTPARPGRPGTVRVRLWSTKAWTVTLRRGARTDPVPPPTRTQHGSACRPSAGSAGYTVAVTRVFRPVGEAAVDHTETFRSVTAPVARVVCR
ncbi:VanW family protein [Nocardioides maradonensis]